MSRNADMGRRDMGSQADDGNNAVHSVASAVGVAGHLLQDDLKNSTKFCRDVGDTSDDTGALRALICVSAR